MPPRDPSVVQLDFPALTADLIGQLQLVGTVGLLNFLPEVRPTFIIGSRGLTIEPQPTVYTPSEVFTGELNNPAGNVIIIDTGQLPAGDYDVIATLSASATAGITARNSLEHRNAANAATLSDFFTFVTPTGTMNYSITIALRLALNERLRWFNGNAFTGKVGGVIAIKRRVVP